MILDGLVTRRSVEGRIWKGGKFPPPKHPLPTQPGKTPAPDCAADNPDEPPPPGCPRITVQIVPSPWLPNDPDNRYGLGYGVGSATLEPVGATASCPGPGGSGCSFQADVAVGTAVTVREQPRSYFATASEPPDSTFYEWKGACTGSGACAFTARASATVEVYFIPATATLTLQESGDPEANMTAVASGGVGGDPANPEYCGEPTYSTSLPCKFLTRVDAVVEVGADASSGYEFAEDGAGFSNNCTWTQGLGSNFCRVTMTSSQTVTATFTQSALG